jgi:hypothetical protein
MTRLATHLLLAFGATALVASACTSVEVAPSTSSTTTGTGGAGGVPAGGGGTGGALACMPGATQPCDCPAGGTGTATCDASGSGYGACVGCDVAWSMRFDGAWSPAMGADDDVYLAITVPGVPSSAGRAIRIAPSGDVVEDMPNDGFLQPVLTSGGAAVFAGAVSKDGMFGGATLGVTAPGVAAVVLGGNGDVGPVHAYLMTDLGLPPSWKLSPYYGNTAAGTGDDGRGALIIPGHDGTDPMKQGRSVVVLSADGALLWSRTIRASPWTIDGGFAAVAPQGDVIAVAPFSGTLDVGGGPEPNIVAAPGQQNGYVVRYGPTGEVLFHRQLAAASDTSFEAMTTAVDLDGNAVVVASATGTVDFGDGPLGMPGTSSVWLAKLSPAGGVLWHRAIDAAGPVAVGPDGDIWVCGWLPAGGTIDGQPATVAGWLDVLLTRYDAGGGTLSHHQFGGPGADRCTFVTVGASGIPVIAGRFEASIDFGQGPLPALDGTDAFVAKLGP